MLTVYSSGFLLFPFPKRAANINNIFLRVVREITLFSGKGHSRQKSRRIAHFRYRLLGKPIVREAFQMRSVFLRMM